MPNFNNCETNVMLSDELITKNLDLLKCPFMLEKRNINSESIWLMSTTIKSILSEENFFVMFSIDSVLLIKEIQGKFFSNAIKPSPSSFCSAITSVR